MVRCRPLISRQAAKDSINSKLTTVHSVHSEFVHDVQVNIFMLKFPLKNTWENLTDPFFSLYYVRMPTASTPTLTAQTTCLPRATAPSSPISAASRRGRRPGSPPPSTVTGAAARAPRAATRRTAVTFKAIPRRCVRFACRLSWPVQDSPEAQSSCGRKATVRGAHHTTLRAQASPVDTPWLEGRLEQLGRSIQAGVDGRVEAVLARLEAAERRIIAHVDQRCPAAAADRDRGPPAAAEASGTVAPPRERVQDDDKKRLKVTARPPRR